MHELKDALNPHFQELLNLCKSVLIKSNREIVLERKFMGRFHLESTWMEETLDAAGSRKNDTWFPVREAVSTLKMLTSVLYDIVHVKSSIPYYNLIDIERDFDLSIVNLISKLYESLIRASKLVIKRSKKVGVKLTDTNFSIDDLKAMDLYNSLPKDRKLRNIENPGKSLIYLATEFLSLKREMKLFNNVVNAEVKDKKNLIPDYFSENKLRLVLSRFHNLQSLYDTYLSESDIEDVDNRLKVLRGHISVIYHLVKSATELTHYYERHIGVINIIDKSKLLELIIDFFMEFPTHYFNAAKEICFNVIDSYAEIEERLISIPPYRGFHVRPSTLISKIIGYYGGKVKLEYKGVFRDPATPLELFRLNEEINSQKRLKLFKLVCDLEIGNLNIEGIVSSLVESGDLLLYSKEIETFDKKEDESKEEFIKRVFTLLLASGSIDIKMDTKVKFIGDKRSLEDIELLAKSGYGEDLYGNNIPLPKKLVYLKR